MKSANTTTKTNGPDYGQSQHKNHSHSKTRLPDYQDSAANVTNSAFYSSYVTLLPADLYSHFQTKTPCHFVTQSTKISSNVVHFQL